ncbi:hypothetical protein IDH44_14645 [Paenibacillus sp. IB182496]|uniref:Uncharacterized protein n=1 Tax=Paenibacillus sabuli TaxID=2772509 RepID=A0A927GT78_9BACL|nr:hypothetical protein [Paenibacillus sabuli]MBD2846437.1 hypothetical protein [Paenibacillus sabuli]
MLRLFQLPGEDYARLDDVADYEVLTGHPAIRGHLCTALSFFAREAVDFDPVKRSFTVRDRPLATADNYSKVAALIATLCGVEQPSAAPKLKNARARELFDKLARLRETRGKTAGDTLELKDLLSILCAMNGNGIDVFNVAELTIYQVYEHFERLKLKESHNRVLPVWANGHLREHDKLPEWISRTKL